MTDDTNSLPVIQSLWIGDTLSVMEQLCISSFLYNGHEFHLYAYDDVRNIPKGTIIKDASKVITPDKIFKYKDRDSYSGFSNVFRYKLLYENGSYWVDTDVICLRPFDLHSDYVFAKSKSGALTKTLRIESCVIKAPPASKIMDYCYLESHRRNPKELVWAEIGPRLLRTAVIKFNLDNYVEKAETFCPIDWQDWKTLISGSLLKSQYYKLIISKSKSRAVHLWNEMWRLSGIDKNAHFSERSIYEQLKRRYLGHAESE